MSTQLVEHAVAARPEFDEFNDFNYRPVPVTAVLGFVLAILSFGGVFIWMALPLCLLATLISLISLVSIRRSRGAYSGGWLAIVGAVLGLGFLFSGIGMQVYAYQTELPPGYQRVSFVRDISEKAFVEVAGQLDINPDVKALVGKEVFLKGFIYPTQDVYGLKSFLLLKDSGQCCFGGKPAITDRLGVEMEEGQLIDYTTGRVSVAGEFSVNPNFQGLDDLEPLYMLKCKHFFKARSDF